MIKGCRQHLTLNKRWIFIENVERKRTFSNVGNVPTPIQTYGESSNIVKFHLNAQTNIKIYLHKTKSGINQITNKICANALMITLYVLYELKNQSTEFALKQITKWIFVHSGSRKNVCSGGFNIIIFEKMHMYNT